jgi:proteasome lid subunit RPN8/RPN11
MVGRREGKACVCDHIVPTENAERSSLSFTISPEELLSGYLHADELDMELVGIYHSHPAPPAPSRTDLGFMKWSAPVWLIVSSLDWRYAAFRSEEGKAVELRLKLV